MKLTRDTIFIATGTIIETLAETKTGQAPEGHIYMALNTAGYDLDSFYSIVELLEKSGLVTRIPGPMLEITAKGRKLAQDMAQIRAEAR